MRVIILGAGAAGFTAAITAAREGATVTIIEQSKKPGKKILMTGNGKCNITNTEMKCECYYGDDSFINNIINIFNWKDAVDFFQSLGISTKNKNGYIYPSGEQAATVLDTLRITAANLGVTVKNNNHVEKIQVDSNGFDVHIGTVLHCDKLIIATGGLSFLDIEAKCKTGYELAKELGHHIEKPKPALTAVICKNTPLKKAAGVRTDARVSALNQRQTVATDTGQIQITDYGLSGIPVFNISRMLRPDMKISIDFMPCFDEKKVKSLIESTMKIRRFMTAKESLNGIFNNRLSKALLEEAGISPLLQAENVSDELIEKLASVIKNYIVSVSSVKGFDFAQVTRGGVSTDEINSSTMESKIIKNLYFAGEVIDIDGICGGYNLHFAWATGVIAGRSCSK